eukprot:4395402-Amphidinium_carterae.1
MASVSRKMGECKEYGALPSSRCRHDGHVKDSARSKGSGQGLGFIGTFTLDCVKSSLSASWAPNECHKGDCWRT